MYFKTIIQGRLSFANSKSFDKVLKMFEYRAETYYKSDILLKQEDIFDRARLVLSVPRYVGNASDKGFKNTISLLDYCAQFAVSGSLNAWMINEGRVINAKQIEPHSDKAVVMQFIKGDKLFKQEGKEKEALEAFNKTLEKFDKHAQAYERRGWINLKLKHYSDALYDFNKAIKLDDSIAFSYYGKAFIAENENNLEEAISNYELTLKKAVALQPLYWKARIKKARCHIELGQWEKAAFDLRFFTSRKFSKGSSNALKKAEAYLLYARVLIELGEAEKALDAINKSFKKSIEDSIHINEKEAWYYKGVAKKMLGKKDFLTDIRKASDEGSEKARDLLLELA